MKSEDEIQRELTYWNGVVAAYHQEGGEYNKVIEARFRIQDLIWVLAKGKGGEASKRFSVSTAVLLELFGDADAGDRQTYREKYEASKDRNSRYGIRKKLLQEARSGRYTSWEIF
ncbi:MAG: hypothetical protein ISS54_06980 [Dehalococcoidia bacterium]|nr:hypothetical protein [Dehalococcoidia bacterium]